MLNVEPCTPRDIYPSGQLPLLVEQLPLRTTTSVNLEYIFHLKTDLNY